MSPRQKSLPLVVLGLKLPDDPRETIKLAKLSWLKKLLPKQGVSEMPVLSEGGDSNAEVNCLLCVSPPSRKRFWIMDEHSSVLFRVLLGASMHRNKVKKKFLCLIPSAPFFCYLFTSPCSGGPDAWSLATQTAAGLLIHLSISLHSWISLLHMGIQV